jgi:hypothetical protein
MLATNKLLSSATKSSTSPAQAAIETTLPGLETAGA